MSDSNIGINEPASPNKLLDSELVGGTVHRERVEIGGAALVEIARVKNADPAGTDYALVTRNLPSGTQPVSAASLPLPTGAATAAIQTDGTQKSIVRGGAKGSTTAADVTSTAEGADHNAVDVQIYHGGTTKDPTAIRALTASDIVTANGDVDHDAANTLKNIQVAGHASPSDVSPALVSAIGDRVRTWADRAGAIIIRPRRLISYTAVYRLAEAAARLELAFTQVANTNKQWATLHHAATATTEARLQKCVVQINGWSVASQGVLELRQITTAPATGNPAITPANHRRGGAASECIALALPTTQATEAAVNSPLAQINIDYGIMGATPTADPLSLQTLGLGLVLYDASVENDEVTPPVLPVGTLDGWAVMLRTVGIPAVRMTVVMRFTEEIP